MEGCKEMGIGYRSGNYIMGYVIKMSTMLKGLSAQKEDYLTWGFMKIKMNGFQRMQINVTIIHIGNSF